ncbi:hypothetical protein ABMA27_007817 [Loxostege sticticalis]|uniref:Transposase n=1 Tax=Loxostege sticticalis TaxID=481309 RepID=A0ABR3HDG9_LOXSC
MLQRITRVSEAQWSIILEFLERNPNLAKARGYNNSARGRQESTRINYKSKLKKIVADINADSSGTGGGPPRGSNWSEVDQRFLAILGPGLGQTAPQVSVNPFPDAPSTSTVLRAQDVSPEDVQLPPKLAKLALGDIHFYYGMARGVSRRARLLYRAAFPNRRPIPSERNFQEVHRRFAREGLRKTRDDANFARKILWMNEATFTRDGITNCRNLHRWCNKGENPRLNRASTFQVKFTVNVWVGLIDNLLIGPIILPQVLTGQRFLQLLSDELLQYLYDIPLELRRNIYLQMDGCPAHYSSIVREYLNEVYPDH